MTTPFIINHLWQSSCFALLAGLLAFALRKNSPKVRYWVWLSASLKFLIPFVLLVSLGSVVPRPARHPASVGAPVFANTLVQIAEPFSPSLKATVPEPAPLHWVPVAIGVVWALGFLAITLARCRSWLKVRVALRASTPIELPIPVRALITPGAEEPGILGFLRPVLVLPAQLLEHLNPRQLGAILTHEMCHVRRRDNFFAAVHMVVEAIFWFHPLVWWIGSRMVEERELACDEEVLRMGCEPADYVEGILKVCRFYRESPLPCISGVRGADVKKRLRAILAGSIAHELNGGKKVILATIGLAALVVPVLIGVLNAPAIRAQNAPATTPKFEVASIKLCKADGIPGGWGSGVAGPSPGRLTLTCLPVMGLIRQSYILFANGRLDPPGKFQAIEGGPAWINSDLYTIVAKAEGTPGQGTMLGPMMRALLEDRFKLKIRREIRQVPVYELTVGKGGPKLRASREGSCVPADVDHPYSPPAKGQRPPQICKMALFTNNGLDDRGATMPDFCKALTNMLDRKVIDKSGIAGVFDFHLAYAPDRPAGLSPPGTRDLTGGTSAPPSDPVGPSIFTALQQQLGLKLEPAKGPDEFLIIDHIERPSEN